MSRLERTTSSGTKRRRKSRKSSIKKQPPQGKNQEISISCSSRSFSDSSKMEDVEVEAIDEEVSISPSCTPKTPRFRIPEISTCPPAPKKARRPLSDCSLHRSQIAFFAPPDLELFFPTLQHISA